MSVQVLGHHVGWQRQAAARRWFSGRVAPSASCGDAKSCVSTACRCRPIAGLCSRTRLTLVVLLSGLVACGVARATLKGGCAKVDITPPLGIPLIGSYGKPSDAVRDELYAKAMVLSDDSNTVAIVCADLLYTPLEEITTPVRAAIQEKLSIPAQNVMVCATHTHSGPEVFTRSKLPREGRLEPASVDQSYLQVLVHKMADAVAIALRNMQEVQIGAAMGRLPEVLYNRRPTDSEGHATMAFTLPADVAATRKIETTGEGDTRVTFTPAPAQTQIEFGPIDPTVFVLRMENADGRLIGSMIGFGCHPVCIYPHLSTTVSADYPAFATRGVEQVEGGTCLFALGLAGNAVPLERGPKACEQIGTALGGEAVRRLQLLATTGDVILKAMRREVTLPVKPSSCPGDRVTTEIQVLRLGSIYLLGLPGEVLVEVGLAIKKRAGIDGLFIVTLANDAVGYICHRQAYEQGGYEPEAGTHLAKGAAEILVEEALALINEAKQPDGGTFVPRVRTRPDRAGVDGRRAGEIR
ncbi:MAG: neutral/alkaline non-lysosomal ceramidase N-terminal domain-containing protein [Sedimentisphaerales bacterium]|nr:neutral/alkaline non-lysosomal ceramidase N-terminal domain-containing protein [Sedimentisphaerales bacterium]